MRQCPTFLKVIRKLSRSSGGKNFPISASKTVGIRVANVELWPNVVSSSAAKIPERGEAETEKIMIDKDKHKFFNIFISEISFLFRAVEFLFLIFI
jgi:hypothetical protein